MQEKNNQEGLFYSSTSGTYFNSKESLTKHYKSDFHRYNLRRKVAGLPPVTRDWFEARKNQLEQLEANRGVSGSQKKLWICPLTKKKFQSLNTYETYTKSKKFQELMKKEGIKIVPEPIIKVIQLDQQDQDSKKTDGSNKKGQVKGEGFVMKPVSTGTTLEEEENGVAEEEEEEEWDTDSEQDVGEDEENELDASNWEEWDITKSLFDNHKSDSLQANLNYMYNKFGFYFPDSEHLSDPEGLIKYLGAKIMYGRVPLYTRGDDEEAKQFRSLQAVQNHMVDIGGCRMCWEGNEEEYEDFYDQEDEQEGMEGGENQLVLSDDQAAQIGAGGYELILPNESSGGVKILGSREFARYYKQRPRLEDGRKSMVVGSIVAQYKQLGILTIQEKREIKEKNKATYKSKQWYEKNRLRKELSNNVNWNLPKNVPY